MIDKLENNRIVSGNIVVVIAILIFLFSSIPGDADVLSSVSSPLFSYFYHFIIFFMFTFVLFSAIKGKRRISQKFIFITLTISLIYAFLDEFHQMFIPFRDPSLRDLLFDVAGSSLSIMFYSYLKKKLKHKN